MEWEKPVLAMKVLITGGAGYIGSTIASACLDAGIVPVILDSLATGRRLLVNGRAFYHGDISDGPLIDRIYADHPDLAAVIHCAALISVPESVADPARYYVENVAKALQLVEHTVRNGGRRFIFSSSAAVYENISSGAVDEGAAVNPQSPYGRSKLMAERMFEDLSAAGQLDVISLRYFNPVGADPGLRTGLPTLNRGHALGKLIDAHAKRRVFDITGVSWPTRDGSGIRDYVHVWDLAQGHVAALRKFADVFAGTTGRYEVINLGSGRGTTVREMIQAFESVVGEPVQVREAEPRPGDVVGCYAATDKAGRLLDWYPKLSLADGIRTSLEWRRKLRALVTTDSPERFGDSPNTTARQPYPRHVPTPA
jgi:UDP-glucose 4-epimerase